MPIGFRLENVERFRFDNGLTILTREDHSVPIVSSMIWYRVGSRSEPEGVTGVSHLLEHMMFKGTRRYKKGAIDYIATRNGGANNAFTSRDYTAYYFNFASDRWQPALEIEAERMHDNVFEPEEFELEREVVLEELRMELDNPWGALRQAVDAAAFAVHPYRNPVIGAYEDVKGMTLEQLVSHYRSFYCPSNAILVLTGDFDTNHTMDKVAELFGTIPPTSPKFVADVTEPPRRGPRRLELKRPSSIPRMLFAFPAPSVLDPHHHAVEIIDRFLSEGKLARLHLRLVEEEHVSSMVTTEFDETKDPFLFVIRAELQPGVAPERVERLVLAEVEKLGQELLCDEDLERARNQCLSQFLADFDTPLDQSVQLGLLETLDRFEYWNSYCDTLLRLTPKDIREAARRYLAVDQMTLGILTDGFQS